MVDKRFTVPVKYCFSHSKIQLNGEVLTNDELVRILNANDGAFVENFALKTENEQLKKEAEQKMKFYNENKELKQTINRLKQNIDELLIINVEEELLKENERLKKDLEHCANRFADDGKNVLLSLR